MQQRKTNEPSVPISTPHELNFGTYLKLLRDRDGIKQSQVVTELQTLLATWTQPMYSDIERGRTAPSFDDLADIYLALREAGVHLNLQDRKQFLALAQAKLEIKRTHRVQKPPEAWDELRGKLARIDHLPEKSEVVPLFQTSLKRPPISSAVRREIHHLLGRETWLESLITMIKGTALKVLVVQGPPGSGKTSEIHRLAYHFHQCIPRYYAVLSELSSIDLERLEPDVALELLLSDILEVVGSTYASMPVTNLQARIKYVLECLTRADRPVVIFLDNAEQILDSQGDVAPTWRHFLTRFAQVQHQACFILATQEWPSSFLAETQLIMSTSVPPLSQREGSALLQTLGIRSVEDQLLGQVVDAVGGMPVCLEWMVRLIREPFLRNEWADCEDGDECAILSRLLEDPALFGGSVAQKVQPLLDRVLGRLSAEATAALQDLAMISVPLGAPALKALYSSPLLLRELREASLLVAYPQRVQLLPMVAAQVRARLTSDQMHAAEERLIQALIQWLNRGTISVREQGTIVTELTCLLLKHRRLLDAAEILVELGWLSSGYGHGSRLAGRAFSVMADFDWHADVLAECGGILLQYYLGRFRGEKLSLKERAQIYQQILDLVTTQQLSLKLTTLAHLVQHIANALIIGKQFAQAHELLDSYLAPRIQQEVDQIDLFAPLLKTKAYALNAQGEQEEERGNKNEAIRLKEEALRIDWQCIEMLRRSETRVSGTKQSTARYHLARLLNEAGYILVNLKRGKEAMKALEESIQIKNAGYAQAGSLSMSLGEMGQALELVGKFQEALRYNAEALEETERLAASGHATAQSDVPVHLINRARLLLRIGSFEEAEHLVNNALPSIRDSRGVYREKAQEILDEIKGCRGAVQDLGREYLDWRLYDLYKEAIQFDVFGWLTHAGPFSLEEQAKWDSLRDRSDEQAKARKEQIIKASRDRELEQALSEEREPCLLYPAIQIEDVRARLAVLQSLAAKVSEEEPNVIVRRLYLEAIEEQADYLQMVEATFEGDAQAFWYHNRRVHTEPAPEEMEIALSHLLSLLVLGSQQETTSATSQGLLEHLQRICDHGALERIRRSQKQKGRDKRADLEKSSVQDQRFISPIVAKRFFEAVLQEYGFSEWQVQLDHATNNFRIEANVRTLFLPAYKDISVSRARDLLGHELEFHVLRAEAGKRSPLALLAEGTKNFLTIDEGIAVYYDQQTAQTQNQVIDEATMTTWIGTLATALAAGVLSIPQTFLHLQQFLEQLYLLDRLLKGEQDLARAKTTARRLSLNRCLRTYRGVPDLSTPGVCYAKDAIYFRGYLQIKQAVKEDPGVLDKLMVGKMAYEHLQEMEELGITVPSIRPRWYAHRPDLDEYILSFGIVSLEDKTP